jgi:hypothetical protein
MNKFTLQQLKLQTVKAALLDEMNIPDGFFRVNETAYLCFTAEQSDVKYNFVLFSNCNIAIEGFAKPGQEEMLEHMQAVVEEALEFVEEVVAEADSKELFAKMNANLGFR